MKRIFNEYCVLAGWRVESGVERQPDFYMVYNIEQRNEVMRCVTKKEAQQIVRAMNKATDAYCASLVE